MPLSDDDIAHLVSQGATDEEIHALDAQEPEQTKPEAPGMLSQMGMGALKGLIPGVNTYQTYKDPTKGPLDVAGALGGDVAGAAGNAIGALTGGALGAGKAALAQGAFGAANPILSPIAQKTGAAGEFLGKQVTGNPLSLLNLLPDNSQSEAVNFAKQIPGQVGRTVGEMIPSGLAILLGGKAYQKATGARPIPAENPQIPKAQALADAGYGDVLTPSHLDANSTDLRAMMDKNPGLAKQYTDRLNKAVTSDFEKTVNPPSISMGEEATGALGSQYGKSFKDAMDARSAAYKKMMERADSYIGEQTTRIGRSTHAGKNFYGKVKDYMKAEGIDSNAIMEKVRNGEAISDADVPLRSQLDAKSVEAAAKLAETARTRAASPIDLDGAIRKYTENQDLFGGDQSASARFGKTMRGIGVDTVDNILQKVDKMNVKQGHKAFYPDWEAQKSNWAQGADTVDKYASNYIPKIDKAGQAINSGLKSPENIFKQDILAGGSQNIATIKKFLTDNKQDPLIVEKMALDSISSKAMKNGNLDVNALEKAYGSIPPEQRNQLLRPEVQKNIEEMIGRAKQAIGPTGPEWGIPTTGGSPTAPKLGMMQKLNDPLKAKALGVGLGGGSGMLVGGPVGGMAGGALGGILGDMLQKRAEAGQFKTAQAHMAPNPELLKLAMERQLPKGAYLPWLKNLAPGTPATLIGASRAGLTNQ